MTNVIDGAWSGLDISRDEGDCAEIDCYYLAF